MEKKNFNTPNMPIGTTLTETDGTQHDFMEIFNALLCAAVTDRETQREIVPERYALLGELYNECAALWNRTPDMKLHPTFALGSIGIEFHDLSLDSKGVAAFMKILSRCTTFEITPLVNGDVRVGITVGGVFKSIE